MFHQKTISAELIIFWQHQGDLSNGGADLEKLFLVNLMGVEDGGLKNAVADEMLFPLWMVLVAPFLAACVHIEARLINTLPRIMTSQICAREWAVCRLLLFHLNHEHACFVYKTWCEKRRRVTNLFNLNPRAVHSTHTRPRSHLSFSLSRTLYYPHRRTNAFLL